MELGKAHYYPAECAVTEPSFLEPFLRRLQHASDLEQADVAALARLCGNLKELAAKRYIYREGERLESFPVVLSGWAARYRILRDGSRQITSVILPGEFCRYGAPTSWKMPDEMIALSRCTVAYLSQAEVHKLTASMPSLAQAFLRYGAFQRATLTSSLVSIGRRDALERMAYFICEVAQRLQAVGLVEKDSYYYPMTQDDLADTLGLTPVHTNRKLQELRRSGYITLRSREMKILDRRGLVQLAGFEPNYLSPNPGHSASAI